MAAVGKQFNTVFDNCLRLNLLKRVRRVCKAMIDDYADNHPDAADAPTLDEMMAAFKPGAQPLSEAYNSEFRDFVCEALARLREGDAPADGAGAAAQPAAGGGAQGAGGAGEGQQGAQPEGGAPVGDAGAAAQPTAGPGGAGQPVGEGEEARELRSDPDYHPPHDDEAADRAITLPRTPRQLLRFHHYVGLRCEKLGIRAPALTPHAQVRCEKGGAAL